MSEKKNEWWIFTFGCGHKWQGHCVKIRGTYEEARKKMVDKYGIKWAFQYSYEEWERKLKDPYRDYPMEVLLEVIE